jgi:hypothetical protein
MFLCEEHRSHLNILTSKRRSTMIKNRKCKGKLKNGAACSYAAKEGSDFCGKHKPVLGSLSKRKRKEGKKETAKNVALMVGVAWNLVQLVEKAVTHYNRSY